MEEYQRYQRYTDPKIQHIYQGINTVVPNLDPREFRIQDARNEEEKPTKAEVRYHAWNTLVPPSATIANACHDRQ